jgi:hypothetical protein
MAGFHSPSVWLEEGSNMSDERKNSGRNHATVLKLDDLRRARERRDGYFPPIRVKVEVACHEEADLAIERRMRAALGSLGCRVGGEDEPDWVLSIIAFSYGDLVELSIVLRRLFRSTFPGTEMARVDSKELGDLCQGKWLYESLRFHGLFGVRRAELNQFLARLANDLATKHWHTETRKQTDTKGKRR